MTQQAWARVLPVAILLVTLGVAISGVVMATRAFETACRVEAGQNELGQLVMRLAGGGVGGDGKIGLPEDWARGGKLVIRLRDCPGTLHPMRIADANAVTVCNLVCETLARGDLDSNLEGPEDYRPALAAGWEVSADRLTYTFHLNKLARFSDGQPVRADDVVFTFRTMLDAQAGGRARAAFLGDLEEVRALDLLTVEFRFSRPYFLAFQAIAGTYILPRHVYDFRDPSEFDRKPGLLVGSGPFVLETKKFGPRTDEIVLRRNEAYWDRGRVAALDAVEFRVIEDDHRAYQLLRTGGVNMMYLLPEQFREAQDEADENFMRHHHVFRSYDPGFGYVYVGWNARRAPMDDSRVRRAMSHLAPRERMIEEVYMGLARPTATPFWSDSRQSDGAVKAPAFDPAAAAALLDEAGWRPIGTGSPAARARDGRADQALKVRLLAPGDGGRVQNVTRVFAEELRKAAVQAEVEPLRWAELQPRLASGDFDGVVLGWSGAVEIDPYLLFHSSQRGPGGLNFIGFSDGEVDRLTEAIRRELDRESRNRLCHELCRVLVREQPYTVLLEPETVIAVSRTFRGVRCYRLGLLPQEWYIPRKP